MRIIYHRKITEQAIAGQVSQRALAEIIAANTGQDALRFQFGHPHFHYDNNAFAGGDAYIKSQRALILPALKDGQPLSAWRAFGRLSHTAQDLYAHSNYVDLWLAKCNGRNPDPEKIGPLDPDILSNPRLHSGNVNYLFDALLFLNLLMPGMLKFTAEDSHTRMNLDGPNRSNFPYAFAAAVKRTQMEFFDVVDSLPDDLRKQFVDL